MTHPATCRGPATRFRPRATLNLLVIPLPLLVVALILPAVTRAGNPRGVPPIRAFCIDFNWGEGRPNGFAKPGLWADAAPDEHVAWYAALGCNTIQTFAVSCNGGNLGIYGFAKPGPTSLPLPVAQYRERPINSFQGNDRNIAVLARAFNGLPLETVSSLYCYSAADNDLLRVLTQNGIEVQRFDTPQAAVDAAGEGAGVLLLADGYPAKTTALDAALFDTATRKRLRLYVEYPSFLPGVEIGVPRGTQWERAVIASDIATFANWSTNALSAQLFPWYSARCGMQTPFFTAAVVCFVATIFFWKYVPETEGKSLEEIEKSWRPA